MTTSRSIRLLTHHHLCQRLFVALLLAVLYSSELVVFDVSSAFVVLQQTRRRQASYHLRRYQKEPYSIELIRCKSQQTRTESKDEVDHLTPDGEGASIPNLTVSLVKSIVGSGVLALPAGVAALGNSPDMVLPACIVIGAIGAMNAYFFSLIGRVCAMTGATGYREAWEKTVGSADAETSSMSSSNSSQWVALVVALKTALSCLAYSMILADSFQSLAIAAGFQDVSRVEALGAVTAFALLPLSLLRDLSSLAPFSILGLLGMAFTTSTMTTRYIDGSYAGGGVFLSDISTELQPSFGSAGPNVSGIVLACTLATAFVAHYNCPRFHSELRDNTADRFNAVVWMSYVISAVVFMGVAAVGFLTFGASSSGFILNNYSPYDPLVTASRAALALSIVLTFPLPFVGFRDGVLNLLQVSEQDRTDDNVTILSLLLLSAVTVGAACIQDLSLVLSVGGDTFSTAVASVFPTLMFRAAVERNASKADKGSIRDANLAFVLMWICIAIGATGSWIAIEKVIH